MIHQIERLKPLSAWSECARASYPMLIGATGVGKTELALALADPYPIDIISVDSVMVYRGMDIGSAKPDDATLSRVPHHLVNVCEIWQTFDVGQFLSGVVDAVKVAEGRGRLPLFVGGTMMYAQALRYGVAPIPACDPSVREDIASEAHQVGWPVMWRALQAVDPCWAEQVDPHDKQRITRGLEVFRSTGRSLSDYHRMPRVYALHPEQLIGVGLVPESRPDHHRLLARRFHQMLESGLEGEVQALMAQPQWSPDLPAMRSVGYAAMQGYLMGSWSYEAMVERAVAATRQLCKRQLTWMRRMPWACCTHDRQQAQRDLQALVQRCLRGFS